MGESSIQQVNILDSCFHSIIEFIYGIFRSFRYENLLVVLVILQLVIHRFINPVENKLVSMVTLGEGSHNYHHTFPWDYKTSEFPYFNFNITTLFIDAMARLGLAYDLRQPSPELVEKVVRNTGYKSAMNGAR